MAAPFAKNVTVAMAPAGLDAFAVRICVTFTGRFAPAAGLVRLTVGGVPLATVTLTGAEVTWLPELSVATAVNAYTPAAEGVNCAVNGAAPEEPMLTPLAKNWTFVIRPLPSEVDAPTVMGLPIGYVLPAVGDVIVTVGTVPDEDVTVTAGEVVLLPSVSVATAVSTNVPVAVGDHVML
jgi:hypothetical protein